MPMRPLQLLSRFHSQPPSRCVRVHHDRVQRAPLLPSCRSLSASRRRPPPRYNNNNNNNNNNGNGHDNNTQTKTTTGTGTGISYLDTWMGSPNSGRRPGPATATSTSTAASSSLPPRIPPLASSSVIFPNNGTLPSFNNVNVAPTTQTQGFVSTSTSIQFDGLPSSAYQMFSLRPSREDTPETLLKRLDLQIDKACANKGDSDNTTSGVDNEMKLSTLPLILDLSVFHPDGSPHRANVETGTLTKMVNAIRSHQHESNNRIGCCLVGVTNLTPNDQSMAEEAHSLKLPIFQSNTQTPSALPQHQNTNAPPPRTRMQTGKKRGGVAPLLRQRRRGVAATTKTADVDVDTTKTISGDTTTSSTSTSTLSTKDDISTADNGIQITGMGKLPLHNQTATNFSTKVHKGSVRSGQLLSSDRPNQSLVIIGSVNPGGEVWSEGDVYVFGKLRGRVLAGLSNVGGTVDKNNADEHVENINSPSIKNNARQAEQKVVSSSDDNSAPATNTSKIFATSFDPELVCIGDTFTTIDNVVQSCGLEDGVGPAMVTVEEDTGELKFERIEL